MTKTSNNKTFIISHRLPYHVTSQGNNFEIKQSLGGLSTGLLSLTNQGTKWIGWDGLKAIKNPSIIVAIKEEFSALDCIPIQLPSKIHNAFYNDVSNGIFWPLYHLQTGKLPLIFSKWSEYKLANKIFAEKALDQLQSGDIAFIQDYHLQLVPELLRNARKELLISFFLHTPFPPYEIFRALPIRNEVIRGLLGADIIGFHCESYADNFKETAKKTLYCDAFDDGLIHEGREIKIIVAPLGVDTKIWENYAKNTRNQPISQHIIQMKTGNPNLQIIFSVERLDYTKGLPRKFLAFEKLLDENPEFRGHVTLIQIAPTSRETVSAYSRYKNQVEQLVSSINGKFASPGYTPIQYISSALSPEELASTYTSIDIMMISPLIDGMNLVAKEFVATRVDVDGVLILSEFAGASGELKDALIVNPYDISGTAATMRTALSMNKEERYRRMLTLRKAIANFDLRKWFEKFTQLEEENPPSVRAKVYQSPCEILEKIPNIRGPLVLFLDYDGTLFPIVRRPELAVPDAGLLGLLKSLLSLENVQVHIISGRKFDELLNWFSGMNIFLHGDHGAISYNPFTSKKTYLFESSEKSKILNEIHDIFELAQRQFHGITLERKTFSSVLHYRSMDPSKKDSLIDFLNSELDQLDNLEVIDILFGKKNIECRFKGVSKYFAVAKSLKDNPEAHHIGIGDDVTDNDIFKALYNIGTTICVGSLESSAQYRLRDTAAVRDLLKQMIFKIKSKT